MATIDSVNKDLNALTDGLSVKELRKALKSSLRKEARRVRKVAVNNLKLSTIKGNKIHNAAKVARSIRSHENRALDGFMVDARYRKPKRGFYLNSKGKLKPAAFWLQHGVGLGSTRKTRKGHNRGSVEALGYMDKTKAEELPKSAKIIATEFEKAVERIKTKTFGK